MDYVHNVTEPIHLPMVQAVHALTPPEANIMLLFEHRGFYLARRFVIGPPLFQAKFFTPPEEFGDAASILRVLKEARVSHLVMSKGPIGPDQAPGWFERQTPLIRGINQCLEKGLLLALWESNEFALLEVRRGD